MSITLNTKVYSFAGYGVSNEATYLNGTGPATGWSRLTAAVSVGSANKATRVMWKLRLPVIATEDSDCSCAGTVLRETTVNIEVITGGTSTGAELTDVSLRIKDLAASPEFLASIASLIRPSA